MATKNKKIDQNGFIPMMIMLIVILALIVWFVYQRVNGANG